MIKKTSEELNEKFVERMEGCFFHPSRDNMYPTKEIKEIALQAMENLWQMESISFEVIEFSNAEMVAKALGIATSTAYELMHEKDFPALKIGSRLLVPKEKFRLWVETKTK